MKEKLLLLLAGATAIATPALCDAGAPSRQTTEVTSLQTKDRAALRHYDLGKKNLAIKGYDPVAYFPEFGGKPKKGSKSITTTHGGVLYRFSSEKHKKAFLANPTRFEPAYGGWCAWAMADGKGSKTGASPKKFTVEGDRLFLFYDGLFGDTRSKWNKKGGAPKLESGSDKNWTRISGEKPPAKAPVKEAPKEEPKKNPKKDPKRDKLTARVKAS